MDYQRFFQESKKDGYTDEEITNYLLENDSSFEEFLNQSKNEGYTPEEVLSYFNTGPKEKELNFQDYATDFGKQAAQGFGIGAISSYGDILDLLGLQAKETLPGEKEKYSREFNVLEKLEKGEVPSFGEMLELSSDEELVPRFSRLPSSKDVEE